jgi:hypothetical protein
VTGSAIDSNIEILEQKIYNVLNTILERHFIIIRVLTAFVFILTPTDATL